MTRYLLTGASGMLGSAVREALADRDLIALTRPQLDVTDPEAVESAVRGADVVINCAAYTDVDGAESDAGTAFAINGVGPELLARAANRNSATLVHLSTDYVFDDRGPAPIDENAAASPISAYGKSKAAGERAVQQFHPDGSYVLRTAWLYGAGGANFASTMLKLAETNDTVSVVTDQVGQPTWTRDLAGWIVQLLDSGASPGIYHGTNSGSASWFDYAQELYRLSGLDPDRVLPTTSAAFPRPAARPSWSVLGHDAWEREGLPRPRRWSVALAEAARGAALRSG